MKLEPTDDTEIRDAYFQFIFPFPLERHCQEKLLRELANEGFVPFRLGELGFEEAYYGGKHRVSHRNMERYFLQSTEQFLFPDTLHSDAFRRLSKRLETKAALRGSHVNVLFAALSADVVLCPFDTGFLTLRVRVHGDEKRLAYGEALEFADRMRHLEDTNKLDESAYVVCEGRSYEEIDEFLFTEIAPPLRRYLEEETASVSFFEKLPLFTNEKMFVVGFVAFPEDAVISLTDRYRAARLDGLDLAGRPRMNATAEPYIANYVSTVGYERWAPDTYFLIGDICLMCLTRESGRRELQLAAYMFGEYYYAVLLNLFHRIVLLKLTSAYSRVRMERKQDQTENLIGDITRFSSNYYFVEIVTQTQGREIFQQLRHSFGSKELFEDVKETLGDLYTYQDTRASRHSGYLLTILTIYSVVSGIFGMNLVVEQLEGGFSWSIRGEFSPYEWIAAIVMFSGLTVGIGLVAGTVLKWSREAVREFRRRP